jgi:proline iminopeptidase
MKDMPADHLTVEVPGASLHVEVVGKGDPLLLMHGGPGGSLYTIAPFRALADEFTVVLYDHRCNGDSACADLATMTWANLVADRRPSVNASASSAG